MTHLNSKPHYALLDGLRGVAALLVVWYHIFEGFQFASGTAVIKGINHGYLAVDFFFILSGFVIGYAYDTRFKKGEITIASFFKRRLIRLHPMVIMGALIGFVSFALTGFERWNGSSAGIALSLLALIATILMLPAVPEMPREVRGNGEMFPLNGPCWSLFFEYIGNILYAFILRKLPTKFLALLAIVLSCGLAWFATTNQSGYGSIGVGWTIDPVNILGGTLRMLCPFTLGLLLNRVFKPIKTKGAFWFCTIVIIVLFHIPYIGINSTISYNGMFESVCIIFIFPAIVFIGASGKTTDNMSNKICGFLGDISFPLYIVHYPIMYVFYRYLIKTKQYNLSQTWPMAIAVVVLSIVLAYVCLKEYDTKVRKWLTKIFLNN